MEELDQSPLHPLLEHLENIHVSLAGIEPGSPALQASTQAKRYSNNLYICCYLCRDFYPLIVSEIFSPPHGSPHCMCSLKTYTHKGWIVYSLTTGTHNVISSNHVGVTTMEELDQSPLYPLHLETNMCLGRNRTRVACIAGEHSRKELFEQLVYLLLGTTI
jgi:hypothetical protein